ncbi:MAG: hypothetical protein P8Z00_02310 [Anaerolineales bacterium]|jgi:hypothetical protein
MNADSSASRIYAAGDSYHVKVKATNGPGSPSASLTVEAIFRHHTCSCRWCNDRSVVVKISCMTAGY